MMHEHDFELIATIAEGEMRPAEQAAAEAALASCDDCRSDLELQREALTILRAAPPVTMTDMERATIHRNVSAAVTPAVKTSVLKPTVPWFQRLMPAMAAAAAALVVVGVGSILITGGGDSDTAAETTTVAGEDIRPATVEESAESTGGVQFDDMADATTTTMGLLAPAMSIVEDFGEVSRDGLKDLALELSSPQEADEGGAHNLERMSLETALVCSDIAGEEGMIEAVGRAAVDGEDAEIYRNQELVNVYATVDCSLIDSFE